MAGRLIAIVPARGGSEGVARKNLKRLAGAPLLMWTLVPACQVCDLVIVSSEDEEIRRAAFDCCGGGYIEDDLRKGCSIKPRDVLIIHERSPMLATGRTPDLPVVLDAYRQIEQEPDDLLLLLRPTAPFRRPEEIRDVGVLMRSYQVDSVRSVVPAAEHPQKMYLEAGYARGREDRARVPLLEPATGVRHRANHPRQWLAPAWRACGFVDAVRADVLVGLGSLEGDRILGWPAPEGRAKIELDEEWQFGWAEALAQEKGWKPGEIG